MRYNTEGIILRRQNFRDGDSFFSIYTKKTGKVEAIARGVKKSKSRLGGHLDYFLIVDLMIAEGKRFNHVAGALIDKNFCQIKKDLGKINLGFYCLEITDYFIKEGKKDKRVFYLLKDLFKILDSNSSSTDYINSVGVTHFYTLKLLDYLGYKPELFNCLKCRVDINSRQYVYFDPLSGGIICDGCVGDEKINQSKISKEAVRLLKFIIKEDLVAMNNQEVDKKLLKETIRIIDSFLLFRLDKDIKSRKFLIAREGLKNF